MGISWQTLWQSCVNSFEIRCCDHVCSFRDQVPNPFPKSGCCGFGVDLKPTKNIQRRVDIVPAPLTMDELHVGRNAHFPSGRVILCTEVLPGAAQPLRYLLKSVPDTDINHFLY